VAFWVGPELRRGIVLLERLLVLFVLAVLATLAGLALNLLVAREAWSSGVAGIGLGGVLVAVAGLAGTLPVASARLRYMQGRGGPRWLPADPARLLGWAARRLQGVIVPAFCLAACAAVWTLRPLAPGGPEATVLGAAAIVLGFPLLLAQRIMAAVPARELDEAEGLAALLRLPVLALPLAGVLEIAAGQGIGVARIGLLGLAILVGLVAAELGLRALGNWFLPPPAPDAARASVASLTARLLAEGSVGRSLAGPIQAQLGLDFSRSWALRFARSAALPVLVGLGMVAWALTGVSLIGLDQRGVYERFGAPVAVWQPGAHLGLPWPLGRVRLVELGVVHTMTLGGTETADATTRAEDPAPESANRLWDRAHPAETSYIIAAADSAGAQSFQSVDADLKVLYRIRADDQSALRAAYGVLAPEALVRSLTGRLLARLFVGRQLPDVIGANREALADGIRRDLQAELDAAGSGIETLAVVIEAIHPPLAAAEAYQNVQAAEIVASTAVAVERGRAQATAAQARQSATDMTDAAKGAAAETVGAADVKLREFTADANAAQIGGEAFLMERYFANLVTALPKAPLVITDHRLTGADAPVIDLRPFGAPPTSAPSGDD